MANWIRKFYLDRSIILLISIGSLSSAAISGIEFQIVRAVGKAEILNNISLSRELAIINARRQALKKLGVSIDPKTVLERERLVDHRIVNPLNGFIRDYQIINEYREDNNYIVEIEAWITSNISDNDVAKYLRNLKIIVGISTKVDNKIYNSEIFENNIVNNLHKYGFEIFDKEQLLALKNTNFYKNALRGSVEAARELGKRLLANLILIGEINIEHSGTIKTESYLEEEGEIVIYRGYPNIRIIETESGKIISSSDVSLEGIKGVGNSKKKAINNTFEMVKKEILVPILNDLFKYSKSFVREIRISIADVPDAQAFYRIKTNLENNINNGEIIDESFLVGESGTLILRYSEKIGILTNIIKQIPNIEIIEETGNTILLRYL